MDLQSADCKEGEKLVVVPLIDLIGHSCVSPKGYADSMDHHDALHFELNKKKNE